METVKNKKRGIAALYRLCPKRHVLLLVSAALILLHLLTRGNKKWMAWLSLHAVQPVHHALGQICSYVNFSVAELLIGMAAGVLIVYIIYQLVCLIVRRNRLQRVYITIITLLSAGLTVYALFCMLWGVYYYGDDFMARSGLEQREISVEELERVTVYFAKLANEYAEKVEREENGLYAADREAILARSDEVFSAIEEEFPCLCGPALRAKGVHFSRIMSYTDFTGFFFPFTAEANVNTDFPPALFASTVAHELSHQRGVAKEQEANFTAVLASLAYGDADYVYSACLLAYTHLGNALYSADYEAWKSVFYSLSDNVQKDFEQNSLYWEQFETPVQTVSNTVYEGFLKSYDQSLGLRSYGACVDLLVNYYLPEAQNA